MTAHVSNSESGMASQMPEIPATRGSSRKAGTKRTKPRSKANVGAVRYPRGSGTGATLEPLASLPIGKGHS